MAGQQLAALSTLDLVNTREFAASFADDDLYIIDYLLSEVINHLLPPVQEFLFKTAIVNRFCASLGDTLMKVGEKGTESGKVVDQQISRAIIKQLDQSSLFIIPLDNRREWYRYHHLFTGFLGRRLREWPGDRIAELYCRCCPERGSWASGRGDRPCVGREGLRASQPLTEPAAPPFAGALRLDYNSCVF